MQFDLVGFIITFIVTLLLARGLRMGIVALADDKEKANAAVNVAYASIGIILLVVIVLSQWR